MNALLPLLTAVKAETLAAVFPLLASQPEGTLNKMIKFLQGVRQIAAVLPLHCADCAWSEGGGRPLWHSSLCTPW